MPNLMIRRYVLAGLFVWLPVLITLFVLRFVLDVIEQLVNFLPVLDRPLYWLGYHIPGSGILISLLIVFFTGMITSNLLGRRLVTWAERMLGKIPFVRPIYQGSKQVLETLFSSNGRSFRQVLLVEYPREGLWSLAFETGTPPKQLTNLLGDDEMVSIFIPTTPNPTSGFLMMVSRKQVIHLDMSVDAALKMIISLGVIQVDPSTAAELISVNTNRKIS